MATYLNDFFSNIACMPKIGKIKKTSIYDIPYFISDISLVKKTYNWTPKKSINQIISDTFKWLKNNKLILKKYLN